MYDYKRTLIPYPQKIEDGGSRIKIASEGKPGYVLTPDPEVKCSIFANAVAIIEKRLAALVMPVDDTAVEFMGEGYNSGEKYPITLEICDCAGDRADSYKIEITAEGAALTGYDSGGVYYAAVTFAKLLSSERGDIFLPVTKIIDWPDFKHRGQFLEDRYGSDFMTLDDYKSVLEYLAAMKYNEVTIGVYGCWQSKQYDNRNPEFFYLPLKKYPQLKTPRSVKYYSVAKREWIYKKELLPTMYADDYFGDMIAYGKEHNIRVKPLFNSLGHNTLLPRMFPETSAKDENNNDTGSGFCTRTDATYELMFNIYDEIIERYLAPHGVDSFEIGLDEVSMNHFCKCDKCRDVEPGELMIEYIIKVCQHLKSKGINNVYIYHDMLFNFEVITEETFKRFESAGVADVAVIDWWSYSKDENLFRGKELSSYFRGIIKPFNGYYHWAVPMEYNDSIYGCAKRAVKYGFEGLESYSSFEYCYDRTFKYQAELSWNVGMLEEREDFYDRYAYDFCPDDYEGAKAALEATRDIMEALLAPNYMNAVDYYWSSYNRNANPIYPNNFPGGIFEKILASRDVYMNYFKRTRARAKQAIDFFKTNIKSNKFMNDTWLAIAMHYYAYSDEYETIVRLYETKADKFELHSELTRLLAQQEEMMLAVENARIEANAYTSLRSHTITRQFMLDWLKYIETTDSPKFEITNFDYIKSDVYYLIR